VFKEGEAAGRAKLLLVDDDPSVLSSLRRVLLRKPDLGYGGLEIEDFTSPSEALRRVESAGGEFDAAIVDYRMPGMDGMTLLQSIREIRPDAVRIVLSGITDMQELAAAIDQARIDYFVPEPWRDYEMTAAIVQALAYRDLEIENKVPADLARRKKNESREDPRWKKET
jgi:DNA-binding NtrC family response regulator